MKMNKIMMPIVTTLATASSIVLIISCNKNTNDKWDNAIDLINYEPKIKPIVESKMKVINAFSLVFENPSVKDIVMDDILCTLAYETKQTSSLIDLLKIFLMDEINWVGNIKVAKTILEHINVEKTSKDKEQQIATLSGDIQLKLQTNIVNSYSIVIGDYDLEVTLKIKSVPYNFWFTKEDLIWDVPGHWSTSLREDVLKADNNWYVETSYLYNCTYLDKKIKPEHGGDNSKKTYNSTNLNDTDHPISTLKLTGWSSFYLKNVKPDSELEFEN